MMPPKLAAGLLAVALQVLSTAPAATEDADSTVQMERILDAQVRALNDVLTPELQQALAASQQSWTAHRDRQCVFELKFSQEQGRGRSTDDAGRDVACVARFNQLRLRELQQEINTLMESNVRPQPMSEEWTGGIGGATDPAKLPQSCRLTGLSENAEVHAVGIRNGLALADVLLTRFGRDEVREAHVVVNKPDAPVVLVLMADNSVLWHVGWMPGTKIVAVVVSGVSRQAVVGVEKATPLLLLSREVPGPCGAFAAWDASPGMLKSNAYIKAMTGRSAKDVVNSPTGGHFVVGNADGIDYDTVITSSDRKLEDNPGAHIVRVGQRGLDDLIAQGKVRRATQEDYDACIVVASAEYRKLNPDFTVRVQTLKMERTYVVLAPVDLPVGLYGNLQSFFIVPDGMRPPTHIEGSYLMLMSNGVCLWNGTNPCQR
jgi:uncharacterized protein YecT (DUF1311 family)